MKKIIAFAALFVTGSAMADSAGTSETGIRYNEVSVGYFANEVSANTNHDLTGYQVAGSLLINKDFIIDASYSDQSGDGLSGTMSSLNVGYRMAVSSNADVVFKLGYTGTDSSSSGSDSSYVIGAGAAVMLTPEVQLAANAAYTGLKQTEYIYGASLGYYLTDTLTVRGLVRATSGDYDTMTYMATIGYNF